MPDQRGEPALLAAAFEHAAIDQRLAVREVEAPLLRLAAVASRQCATAAGGPSLNRASPCSIFRAWSGATGGGFCCARAGGQTSTTRARARIFRAPSLASSFTERGSLDIRHEGQPRRRHVHPVLAGGEDRRPRSILNAEPPGSPLQPPKIARVFFWRHACDEPRQPAQARPQALPPSPRGAGGGRPSIAPATRAHRARRSPASHRKPAENPSAPYQGGAGGFDGLTPGGSPTSVASATRAPRARRIHANHSPHPSLIKLVLVLFAQRGVWGGAKSWPPISPSPPSRLCTPWT